MLRPVYLHGPPVAKQTKSLRLASRRGALLLANFLLTRESLSTFPAKSSTTAEIASLPPRRSKSDLDGAGAAAGAEATGAPLSPSGGAGLKFGGSSVPVWGDSLSTMSLLNPASAQQFFLLRRRDVELVQSLNQVFDQRGELARRGPHILVGFLHAEAGIPARAAGGEADEIFEIGEQPRGIALAELLVDARVGEHVPGEVVDHGRDRVFAAEALVE